MLLQTWINLVKTTTVTNIMVIANADKKTLPNEHAGWDKKGRK